MIQVRGLISDTSFLKKLQFRTMFPLRCSIWVTMLCVFRGVHTKHNEGKARAMCICPGNRGFQRGQLSNSCRKKLWDGQGPRSFWAMAESEVLYLLYNFIYNLYLFYFFNILLWRSSNVCKMQRLIPYIPDLPSFTIFNLWPILLYLYSKPLILLWQANLRVT